MNAINIKDKFSKFSKNWHPHQIALVDDMQVILAKVKGEFVWHSHENEDELFQVVKGTLYMQFRDRTEVVNQGEIIVVPKGVEHTRHYQEDSISTMRSHYYCSWSEQSSLLHYHNAVVCFSY